MNKIRLPKAHQSRLRHIINCLEKNHCGHRMFRGKRLQQNPLVVSIPVGRNWRALFAKLETGYRFRGCFSHEDYNKLKFNQIR